MAQTKKDQSQWSLHRSGRGASLFLQKLFDAEPDEEEPMEDDVPYDDQFDEVVSSSDDDEDEEEGGKVCCPGRSEKERPTFLSSQLDIEKQSKKIREKQRQSKERSDQELLTNIQQQETIQFPSGQEVTKDGTKDLSSSPDDHQSCLAPQADLQLLMHRIREVINVLNDFKNKREANR